MPFFSEIRERSWRFGLTAQKALTIINMTHSLCHVRAFLFVLTLSNESNVYNAVLMAYCVVTNDNTVLIRVLC